MNWNPVDGEWQINECLLLQDSPIGVTRCFKKIDSQDFIASFDVTLREAKNDRTGEAKFLFSDAENSDNFRIDFIYAAGGCRIFANGWIYPVPLSIVKGKAHNVRVVIKSNFVSIDVDGVPVVRQFQFGKQSDGVIGFGTWEATATFENIVISPLKEINCFVIMPFDEKRNIIYEDVIKPTLNSHKEFLFRVKRADESLTVGKISEEIGQQIDDADVVVADISSVNANVYYELGYSHAKKQKAVLLIQRTEGEKLDIPFDIQDFRCHSYEFSSAGLRKLGTHLADLMSSILEGMS